MEKKKSKQYLKAKLACKLACKGCGHIHNRVHRSFNSCPVCLCCHNIPLSSIHRPRFVWYVGVKKLDESVSDTHKWWKTFDVKGMCTAEEVTDKIAIFLEKVEQK